MRKFSRLDRLIQTAGRRYKLISAILRHLNPNYSFCRKCGLPWNWCESKSVMTSSHSGTFATCDVCWDNSTLPELRLHYVHTYYDQKLSLLGSGYEMEHSVDHLLECVDKEFSKTRKP